MITAINTAVEYGKGQIELYPMAELTNELYPIFAHSMDEALAWVKASPFYKDAEIVTNHDGSVTVTSPWIENRLTSILADEEATHLRHRLHIAHVNTAFVTHKGVA